METVHLRWCGHYSRRSDPLWLNPALRIGIKPNLVVAKPAKSGATTSPEVVESLIGYLHSRGLHDICVMESSWVG